MENNNDDILKAFMKEMEEEDRVLESNRKLSKYLYDFYKSLIHAGFVPPDAFALTQTMLIKLIGK